MNYLPTRLLLALGAALFCLGCKKFDYETRTSYYANPVAGQQPDSLLTCVTYNIQLGFRDGQDPWNPNERGGAAAHLDSLARVLKCVHPDIICLQEVPRNRSNVDTKDFVEQLAARLQMNYAFGAHGYNEVTGLKEARGEWGNAILTRFTIAAIENREVEYVDTWRRRSVLMAQLQAGSKQLHVYSVHFQPGAVALPATALALFRERRGSAQLIMGDFNLQQVPQLAPTDYTDVLAASPSHRFDIDRLYVSVGQAEVRQVETIPRSGVLSDHAANYCRLKLQ